MSRRRGSTTLSSREPDIQVWSVDVRGDRSLTLRHTRHNNRPLHEGAQEVLKHVARLWGFGVNLESVDSYGDVATHWAITPSESAKASASRSGPAETAPSHFGARVGRTIAFPKDEDSRLEREDLPADS